jgi:hypothetical protein
VEEIVEPAPMYARLLQGVVILSNNVACVESREDLAGVIVQAMNFESARRKVFEGASPFTRFMSRFITVADPHPGWRNPVILGWAGMRSVASLAAALSIPLLISEGQPFPYRYLILFFTFVAILVTLVFRGLTLPWLIRKVAPVDKHTAIPQHQQERIIQKKIARASLQFLEEKYGKDRVQNEHLDNLIARLQIDLRSLDQELEEPNGKKENIFG